MIFEKKIEPKERVLRQTIIVNLSSGEDVIHHLYFRTLFCIDDFEDTIFQTAYENATENMEYVIMRIIRDGFKSDDGVYISPASIDSIRKSGKLVEEEAGNESEFRRWTF